MNRGVGSVGSVVATKNYSTNGTLAPGARCPECSFLGGAAIGQFDGQVLLCQKSSSSAAQLADLFLVVASVVSDGWVMAGQGYL